MKKITLSAMLALASIGASAQFSQNFDAAEEMPAGWSSINQGSENGWGVTSAISGGAHSGANAAAIVYDSSVAHDDYLITPQITVTPGVSDQFSFWIRSRSATFAEPYEVRISTTTPTAAAFTGVLQASQEAAATWEEKTFDLSNYQGQNVYIAIRATGTNEWELYVDDVVSGALPACPVVSGISTGALTSESAEIVFTSSASAWEYFIGDSATTEPVDAEAVSVDSNPFTIEGLDSATSYNVWIRPVCGEETGEWSQVFSFLTPCVPFAVPSTLETYESTNEGAVPVCWNTILVSGTNNWQVDENPAGDITSTVSGTKIMFKNYNTSEAVLVSPAYDYSNVTEATRVSVFLHRHANADDADKYVIYANTNPTLQGAVQLYEQFSVTTSTPEVPSTGFYNYKVNVPASFNGAGQVYILVQGITTAGFSSYALGVDDFRVEYVPGCAEVAPVSVSDVTAYTATFTWEYSASQPANGYEYAYSTTNSADEAEFSGTTANDVITVDVDQLEPVTTYYVWVRSVCSETEVSPWSFVSSFTTLCAPVAEASLPWTEGFEDLETVGDGIFPPCWLEENGDWSTADNDSSIYDSDAHSGTQFLRIYYNATNEYIWTPAFELTAGIEYDFSFWFASYGDYDTWEGDVVVNSSQSSNGATVLGEAFMVSGTTPPNAYTQVSRLFTPNVSGVYHFGLHVNEPTFSPWYVSFDDFQVQAAPLSTGDFQQNQLSFYPNPVKDRLNLSFGQQISSVAVVNMLGQQVISQAVQANEATIDMSVLSAGTYFVKVSSANAEKTIKVIKQ